MQRRRRKMEVDTFPFLAVLLCAMGSLILLLMVMDRRAKIVAQSKAREELLARKQRSDARNEATRLAHKQAEEEAQRLWHKQKDAIHLQLKSEHDALLTQLAVLRDELNRVDRRTQDNLSIQKALAKKLDAEGAAFKHRQADLAMMADQLRQAKDEERTHLAARQRLTEEVLALESTLRALQERRSRERPVYSLVPYRGRQGSDRKPIYVEITRDDVAFRPGKDLLSGRDWTPDAFRQLVEKRTGPLEREKKSFLPIPASADAPYLLFLVRPDGISRYYEALSALAGYRLDFGYELIEPDWVFDFNDGNLDHQPWRNVATLNVEPADPKRPAPKGVGTSTLGPPNRVPGTLTHLPRDFPALPPKGSSDAFPYPSVGSQGVSTGPSGMGPSKGISVRPGASPDPGNTAPPGSLSFRGIPGSPGIGSGIPGMGGSGSGIPDVGVPTSSPFGKPGVTLPNAGQPGGLPGVISPNGGSSPGGTVVMGPGGSPSAGPTFVRVPGGGQPGTGAPASGIPGSGPLPPAKSGTGVPGSDASNGAASNPLASSVTQPGAPGATAGPPGTQPSGNGTGVAGSGSPPSSNPSASPSPAGIGTNLGPPGGAFTGGGPSRPPFGGAGGSASGDSDGGEPGFNIPSFPSLNLKKEKSLPGPRPPRIGRLLGNLDFIMTIECQSNQMLLVPPGQAFDVGQPGSAESLVDTVRELVRRRQATVRPGEPLYRPAFRFRVTDDGLRTYYLIYPRLAELGYPMSRESTD